MFLNRFFKNPDRSGLERSAHDRANRRSRSFYYLVQKEYHLVFPSFRRRILNPYRIKNSRRQRGASRRYGARPLSGINPTY